MVEGGMDGHDEMVEGGRKDDDDDVGYDIQVLLHDVDDDRLHNANVAGKDDNADDDDNVMIEK